MGLSAEKRTFLDQRAELILSLHDEGCKQKDIAHAVGSSQGLVSKWLRERGRSGRNYRFWDPTKRQLSILVGTLLGDGHLQVTDHTVNAHLKWTHGELQKEYLSWKAKQFDKLFNKTTPSKWLKPDGKWLYQLGSRVHPALNDYHSLFYSRPDDQVNKHVHKKMFTQEILDQVDDLALAVWWVDDGTSDRRRIRISLALCLGGLTVSEYTLVKCWFEDQGYSPTWHDWLPAGKNAAKLAFSVVDSEHLLSRMLEYVPECMSYKFKSKRV